MKKIFLLLFLLTCLLSFNFANAGVNETGSSSISLECKKTMLKKYQSDLSVSKSEGKNFLMYASVTENDCVWYQTWPKKEVSKKDHKYAFKKCTKEAKKNKIPIVSRADMLAELMKNKKCIAIAGSHGKTTTTSLVGNILETGKLDPTIVNGGIINSISKNKKKLHTHRCRRR